MVRKATLPVYADNLLFTGTPGRSPAAGPKPRPYVDTGSMAAMETAFIRTWDDSGNQNARFRTGGRLSVLAALDAIEPCFLAAPGEGVFSNERADYL